MMSTAGASAAALLTALVRRGIELQARGDRLRYRPRSALTPGLVERIRAHKPELLALLRGIRVPRATQKRQSRPVLSVAFEAGRVTRPDAPERTGVSDAPHELSLAERVESGYVNPGWTAQAWADRLHQLASRCEALRPELAAQYRTWAANVRKNAKRLG